MRQRLQLKWMLTASTVLATSFTLTSAARAAEGDGTSQGVATTEEHGHTVYVNDDAPAKERPAAAPQVRRSRLVYGSGKESRWKAVPSAKTESGKAARSAAAEVSEFYGRDSVQSANAKVLQAKSHRPQATPVEIDQSTVMAAGRHNVDPSLVRAVIKVEWNFDSNAVSCKGAMGLMQVLPKTARELNVKNPVDPEQNVDAGVRHLKFLLEKYNGDVNRLWPRTTRGGELSGGAQTFRTLPKPRITQGGLRIFGYGGFDLSQSASRDPVHVQRDERGALYISNTD